MSQKVRKGGWVRSRQAQFSLESGVIFFSYLKLFRSSKLVDFEIGGLPFAAWLVSAYSMS